MASEDLTSPPPPPLPSPLFFTNQSSSSSSPNPPFLSSLPMPNHHPSSCINAGISNQCSQNAVSSLQLHTANSPSAFRTLALKQNYGKDSTDVHLSGEATIKKHSNIVVKGHTLDPQSSPAGKRKSRLNHPKKAQSGNEKLNAESLNGLNPATGGRYDSSLGLLTKKFVELVQDQDGTLDLNKSAEVLQVQKRRIYDITNVLEGIDLIEKTSKNHIRWKGYHGCESKDLDAQTTELQDEVQRLRAEECRLDEYIREKQHLLSALEEDENNKQYLFLTEEDITALSCFQNKTVIAIKAPPASYIEVPDPDDDVGSPQYKMIIRGNTGPIDLYLLSQYNQKGEDAELEQTKRHSSSAPKSEEPCQNQQQPKQQNQNNVNELVSSTNAESSGIQKILPSDCNVDDDYWFHSNTEVSLSELWRKFEV